MAEGLITDCRLLLSRFENLQSVRFERFCEVWREMNFSLIHCGGKDSNGRIQIVDYLFRIIGTYLDSAPCTFQYRIGALYALYAVYHTQPCQPKVKIRMTLSMMKDLKELHEQIIKQQHHDADYILRSLKNEKAFLFVAMPIPLSYGSKEAITSQEGTQSSVLIDEVNDNVGERHRALEIIGNAHNVYKELKMRLQSKGAIPSDRSVNAISDDLVQDMTGALDKFDDWQRRRCQKHILEKKTGTSLSDQGSATTEGKPSTSGEAVCSTTPADDKDDSSKRIREIKKRSFSTIPKLSRSMRYLQSSTAESPDPPNKIRRHKK